HRASLFDLTWPGRSSVHCLTPSMGLGRGGSQYEQGEAREEGAEGEEGEAVQGAAGRVRIPAEARGARRHSQGRRTGQGNAVRAGCRPRRGQAGPHREVVPPTAPVSTRRGGRPSAPPIVWTRVRTSRRAFHPPQWNVSPS